MSNSTQRKVGRPSSNKQYRKNVMRVAAFEDWIEDIIEKVPERSEAKKILVEELDKFRLQEKQKLKKRITV